MDPKQDSGRLVDQLEMIAVGPKRRYFPWLSPCQVFQAREVLCTFLRCDLRAAWQGLAQGRLSHYWRKRQHPDGQQQPRKIKKEQTKNQKTTTMSVLDWNESQVNQFFISLGLTRYELAIKGNIYPFLNSSSSAHSTKSIIRTCSHWRCSHPSR